MENLWKKKGVPKKNWQIVEVIDRGINNLTVCEMCGVQHIRYEHHAHHSNYVKPLVVGCVCAENMSEAYKGKEAEALVQRRTHFLTKGWKTPDVDLLCKNYKGTYIEVFKTGNNYRFYVTDKVNIDCYFTSKYIGDFGSAESAKNAVWQLLVDEGRI